MVMTIDIPEEVVRAAATRGIAVEVLIQERLHGASEFASRPGFTRFGSASKTASEAVADIRELRSCQTLGGEVTIKQLIEEGRRY
ncbi:MAG: hypothetical protein ABI147_03740 [Acidobacteriaceae bacterium]